MEHKTYCEKCGQDLNEKKIVWLYYNRDENRYTNKQTDETFSFGSACAKSVLKNNGKI